MIPLGILDMMSQTVIINKQKSHFISNWETKYIKIYKTVYYISRYLEVIHFLIAAERQLTWIIQETTKDPLVSSTVILIWYV